MVDDQEDRAAREAVLLAPAVAAAIRAELPRLAEDVVARIIAEVPAYDDAFSGPMGSRIRTAVQVALGGFVSIASGRRGSEVPAPRADAMEGAYQLGRGEARSGRTSDALLAAYRIGARVAWQHLSAQALAQGVDAATVAYFAQMVFTYIDELSAASAAGHADESATSGRVRQRLLDRLARHLLAGAAPAVVLGAAERADWSPPSTLTAVIAPESQVGPLMHALPGATLQVNELAEIEGATLLLVPDAHGRRRASLLRSLEGRGCLAGPARDWLDVSASYARALRARSLGLPDDTEAHLAELVLTADGDALADLRAQVLAPLRDLRPAAAARLTETLRSWLLHHGRRDDIAAALFVHPQTVRYRVGQLRELYGDALEDPATVLGLTLALGVPGAGPPG
ncbi:PucR family transcriptional regulator [Nocardioides sp. GY 10113]|uniref:PucR family transcriptional regulator n=1 Tax=Nocardioides sp. GY 10113 TaxID=2569761 RepID=UPI0010A8C98B|nr:PucR family transcriptional regulator [Nocardioides sp. GY 10113]TIC83596.1 PucR family transcriptional regulator [Nocardioides sp. GY 10113]